MGTTLIRTATKKVTNQLDKMLKLIIDNHDLAKEAIRDVDSSKALKVIENDSKVDSMYFKIESELEFMITKAPVDKDLRRVLASLHIVRELESIGDYAKHIAKFVIKTNKMAKSSINRIDKVHISFRKMLTQVSNLIKSEDPYKALELADLDNNVDEIVEKTRKSIINSIAKKQDESDVMQRIFVFKVIDALERAADNIVIICEMISYIATGKHSSFN